MSITPTRRSLLKTGTAAAIGTILPNVISPSSAMAATSTSPLRRGFNLPDWAGYLDGRAPANATLETLAHLGFNAVRLPINPQHVLGDQSKARLKHIYIAVTKLQAANFAVTLDMHLDDDSIAALQSNEKTMRAQLVAAWKMLSAVLKDLPADTTYAELLNEPPMEKSAWLILRNQLAATVRDACPHHPIIWGAARYQGIWETVEYPPLDDTNAIAAVHYYWPLGFTHQCASWGDPAMAKLQNLRFPSTRTAPEVQGLRRTLQGQNDKDAVDVLDDSFRTNWSYDVIDADFADLSAWSARTNTPVTLNEFGVFDECVDPISRHNWIAHVRRTAEKNGFSWAYWELDHGFGFMADRQNPDSIDYAITAALLAG